MAVLSQSSNEGRAQGSIYQPCFDVNKLVAFKPSTKASSEFRPIPEVTKKGEILPMVLGQTPAGPDYSALVRESVVVNAGVAVKYTGLCRSSDMEETEELRMIFPGLFIRLRSMEKKGTLPAHIAAKAVELLASRQPAGSTSEIKTQYLPRAQNLVFMQGISISENGKTLEKPAARKAMVLSSTAAESLNDLLKDCFAKKIDVFSPSKGYSIVVKGLPADKKVGRLIPIFVCELGRQIPLTEEKVKSLWTPWESGLVVKTQSELLRKAIAAFGADIVEVVFPDEYAALVADDRMKVQTPVVTRTAPPAKVAPPEAPTAPVLEVDDGPPQLTAGEEDQESMFAADVPAPGHEKTAHAGVPDGAQAAADFDQLLKDLE